MYISTLCDLIINSLRAGSSNSFLIIVCFPVPGTGVC